ncbi:glycosyltransferase [Arthrobacter sp. FX8]|uniref:glycosyltransferase n=1 Tax=Arthrobacter sp. FX8 TaxID=2997335 RepID=UPI00227ADAE6|nr:glycosyltransferase [Arthrobacter sp. FX8]WAJ32011.1 glycosyltransferase [Arthrobacter sp. FX8]
MHDESATLKGTGVPLGTADSAAAVQFGRNYRTKKKFVFVVNNDRFFLTHRASWATALAASGGGIIVIAQDTGHSAAIRALGFQFIPLHFGRESVSVQEAAKTASKLLLLLLQLRPHGVFLVATAAYSLGWPAALLLPQTRFIRVITGAGRALTADSASSGATGVVRRGLGISARFPNVHSLFQLESDRDRFVAERLAAAARSHVVAGTGIDTNTWTPPETYERPLPVVLFAARLFREKGIYEFIDLARDTPKGLAKFVVVGKPDTGVNSSVTDEELKAWQAEKIIEYLGESDDMLGTYRGADIYVLPSTHPEGTPRSLIEAAACGVVAIASDQPGCRAVVKDGETGLIARIEETGSFQAALERLLNDSDYRQFLSDGARDRAVKEFSLHGTLSRIYPIAGVEP